MNAAKTILEGLFGCTLEDAGNGRYWINKDGQRYLQWSLDDAGVLDFVNEHLAILYGSIHACAEKAAEWLRKQRPDFTGRYAEWQERGFWTVGYMSKAYTDLELIEAAVEAGWEG